MLVSEVIDRTFSEWLNPAGINRPAWDTVKTAGVLSGVTEGTFEVDGRVTNIPNDTIVEIDSELVLTKLVTGAAPTVVVTTGERGYRESVAATHAVGSKVYVDPKFPRINILNALASVVGTLYPLGLYQRVLDSTITWDTKQVAALPAGTEDVLAVICRRPGTDENYTDNLMEGRDYRILWEFSPPKIRFIRGGYPDQLVSMVLKKDFTLPTAESDNLTTQGIPVTLQPYLPMAVAGFLLQGREIPRVQIEEIKRMIAAQGIQVGAALNVGQTLLHQFQDRYVANERKRMYEKDPTRFALRRS